MSVIRDFFSLEALDTRLGPSTDLKKRELVIKRASAKSRWKTLEYRVYVLVCCLVVPLLLKTAMDASNETNPNYHKFEHLLSNGWMFGRKVDNSDQQYRFFRNNFFMLLMLVGAHVSLRRLVDMVLDLPYRTLFDFCFGVFFLVGAHGVNSLKVLIHFTIMFCIGRYIHNRKVATWATWIYGISTLFINDQYRDFKLGIDVVDTGFKGIIDRWDVFFNFSLLRMISFNMDYIEKRKEIDSGKNQVDKIDASALHELDDKQRLVAPLPISDYNIVNYFAYLTYTPLFIAGPIITFNDYIYQSNYQQLLSVKDYKRTIIYGLRLVFCILVMEFILHTMYVVAVSKTKAWDGDTPFQISMIGFINLNIIWLKLLIPWRLFRFWTLLDGIDPPENMIRCMSNNFSALAFWRAWHRSFNRWVIRYLYVPLGGGSSNRIVNNLLVFSFVAIWHDIELKLLMWGWLVVIFLLPEIAATLIFKKYENKWFYRHLCAAGAVINIWMMMIANLFGFCLGQDGTVGLLKEMFQTLHGFKFFVISSCCLFIGSQIMFERRESEIRNGIYVRC